MADRTLIVYFSHEGEAYVSGRIVKLPMGNTRVAAGMLEELTGADIFCIEPVNPYPDDYRQTIDIAKKELQAAARPGIRGVTPDVREYETIILGYPNWWGTFPMIVATFLESSDFSGKTILPLCTNEGSGMGTSEMDIKNICSQSDVRPGLAVTGGQVKHARPQIETWLRANKIIK